MKAEKRVLAIDLGASSGRGIVCAFDGEKIEQTVVHRFPNGAVEENGALVWEAERIYREICTAIRLACETFGRIDGIGIDTWGVDFGLIGKDGKLLENPRHYRNPANTQMRKKYAEKDKAYFEIAGISVNDFNTTYQLLAKKESGFDWENVQSLLFMPQLFGYLLTGVAATEPTIASTSGFFAKGAFDEAFLKEANVPLRVFPKVFHPFERLGTLNAETKELSGINEDIPVFLTPGHDTACAVLCCVNEPSLYLSSGTWSLFGTKLSQPITTEQAFRANYTNEIGGDGKVRFLRNIMGMWVIQECRREWQENGLSLDYPEIVTQAREAENTGAIIDINDEIFFSPGNMASKVKEYVRKWQGIVLRTVGEVAACVYQSMAIAYRNAYEELCKITQRRYGTLQILGGGSNNAYLNEMIARELGVSVLSGPSEASALGNALGQLIGLHVLSLDEIKDILSCGQLD